MKVYALTEFFPVDEPGSYDGTVTGIYADAAVAERVGAERHAAYVSNEAEWKKVSEEFERLCTSEGLSRWGLQTKRHDELLAAAKVNVGYVERPSRTSAYRVREVELIA
ncbi:MAG: hypothetical protein WC551_07785 [Patescibacteria group bacterium]